MDRKSSAISEMEKAIDEVMRACGTSSLSYGVVHHGQLRYSVSHGFRDRERNLAANSSTLYPLASLSKSFLAAAVGILVSEEKLQWREPISTYISGFDPLQDFNIGRMANLIDVLSHATGLAQHDLLHTGPYGRTINKRSLLINILNNLPARNDNGPRFRRWWLYNNVASTLAATAIENVSGIPYADFVHRNIIEPLCLQRTTLHGKDIIQDSNVALPYARMSDGTHARLRMPDHVEIGGDSSESVHCGVWSSVDDLLAWAVANMQAEQDELPASSKLDSRTDKPVLKELQTIRSGYCEQPPRDEYGQSCSYGLGWLNVTSPSSHVGLIGFNKETNDSGADLNSVLGTGSPSLRIVMHNGKLPGFNSTLMTFPDTNSAVAVLASGGTDGDPTDWCARILMQELFDLSPKVDITALVLEEAKLSKEWFDRVLMRPFREGQTGVRLAWTPSDYTGSYANELICTTIHICEGLKVHFNDRSDAACDLGYYCDESFSFMPRNRDAWLRDSMVDYCHHQTMLLRFQRGSSQEIEGLWWHWNSEEEASWFSRLKT